MPTRTRAAFHYYHHPHSPCRAHWKVCIPQSLSRTRRRSSKSLAKSMKSTVSSVSPFFKCNDLATHCPVCWPSQRKGSLFVTFRRKVGKKNFSAASRLFIAALGFWNRRVFLLAGRRGFLLCQSDQRIEFVIRFASLRVFKELSLSFLSIQACQLATDPRAGG